MAISRASDIRHSRKMKGGVLLLLTLLVVNLSLSALNCVTYQEFNDTLFLQPLQIEDVSGEVVEIPLSACNHPGQRSSSKEDQKSASDCDYCLSHNSRQQASNPALAKTPTAPQQSLFLFSSKLISRIFKGDRQSRAPPTIV